MATLRDLVGAFTPLYVRRQANEIRDQLQKVPTALIEYGNTTSGCLRICADMGGPSRRPVGYHVG